MSAFKGLKKILEAAVDVVMVVPDVAADMVKQEWHDPEVESRTARRLKRVGRRVVEGGSDIYRNEEEKELPEELTHMRDKFSE